MRNDVWAYTAGLVSSLAIVGAVALIFTLTNPLAPGNDAEATAERFGVNIVWDASFAGCGGVGCFVQSTPSVIYVSPHLDDDTERRIVLHELGHAVQWRLGLALDECAADRFAESLGGGAGTYC